MRQVLLPPGEDISCPLPELVPQETLDQYLEKARETAAGTPVEGLWTTSSEGALAKHATPIGSSLRIRWRLPLELRQLVAAAYQLDSGVYSREALVLNLAAQAADVAPDQSFAALANHKSARMLRLDATLLEAMPRLTDVR